MNIVKDKVMSLKEITKKCSEYETNGRQPALSSGSDLPEGTTDEDGVLTGNYQLVEYEKEGQDMFLCLGEFKWGKYTDTTAVNHKEPRLKKGQPILVSVKVINGIKRNRIKFV